MKNSVLPRYQCCFCVVVVLIQNIIVIASEIIIPSKCRTRKLVLVVGKAVLKEPEISSVKICNLVYDYFLSCL